MGDPAGIGPETIAKAWEQRKDRALPPFLAVGDQAMFARHCEVETIFAPDDAKSVFSRALPVLHVADSGNVTPGQPSLSGAHAAFQSLEIAVGLARSSSVQAIVTGPVSKSELVKVGFTHPGQTEFIAERCGVSKSNAIMMLAGPDLRVVPITVHVALRDVPSMLTIDLLKARAFAVARGLAKNFGILEPRLAMTGLNPHSGESGRFGDEEQTVISPAISELQAEGMDIVGPLAADTVFHAESRSRFDAILCQYHDQALIPLKTLYFDDGVNMTLGLPIIRTSPDHGTAFGIAGKDEARAQSMISAILLAEKAAAKRREYDG